MNRPFFRPCFRVLVVGSILAASAFGDPAPAASPPEPGPALKAKDSGPEKAADSAVAPVSPIAPIAPVAPSDTLAAAADSGRVDSAGLDVKFYEYIAYPFLQALTMPVELVLVPVVKAAIYPTKPPLRYILNENVIDRTIQLISFGDREQVMLYPTINLAPGTGSYTGLTLRHRALFGRPTERMVAMGNIYVNGDWKFRCYLTGSELFGSGFDSKVVIQFNRMKNTSIYQPGTNVTWAYADTSNVISASLGHRLIEQLGAKTSFIFRDNHYSKAPPGGDSLVSDFFRDGSGRLDPSSRGLEKDWHDRILTFGLFRDTRNNENIPLDGSDFKFNWHYHFTDANHDFHGWEGLWTKYYKLGKERYEITGEEERAAGPMNIKKILKQIEIKKLREQIFSRKVVALHAYAAQSYELDGNRMPTYGLMTLGNDTPLRGYGGARFRDYTVASLGAEYRFPVMRLMDGMLFNEYGVFGRSWDKFDIADNLRNSWGFGINVRRPDIFLFRVHAGFHGLTGIQLNMSVDTYY